METEHDRCQDTDYWSLWRHSYAQRWMNHIPAVLENMVTITYNETIAMH